MNKQEAEMRGKEIVAEVATHMKAIETLQEESVALSRDFTSKAQHLLNKGFWRAIRFAHKAGNAFCAAMGWTEGGK